MVYTKDGNAVLFRGTVQEDRDTGRDQDLETLNPENCY